MSDIELLTQIQCNMILKYNYKNISNNFLSKKFQKNQ